jgi:ParB/RepB/Spo0J family partition protein
MEAQIRMIPVDQIIPNRFQPRLEFDQEALNTLANSIKQHGIIQPLVLRRVADKYEIIAGERRFKASQMCGMMQVPAIITDLDDNESAEVAIIENTQRRELSAIEEAQSYKKLLDRKYLTQEQLAQRLGTSQSNIANKIRLLQLDKAVQEALMKNQISERHARSLLRVQDPKKQVELLNRVIQERIKVRDLEKEIDKILGLYDNQKAAVGGINIGKGDIDIETLTQTAQDITPTYATDIPIYQHQTNKEEKKPKNNTLFGNKLEDEAANMDSSLGFGFNPFQTQAVNGVGVGDDYDLLELEDNDDSEETQDDTPTQTPTVVKQVVQDEKYETADDVIAGIKRIMDACKECNLVVSSEEFNFDEEYQFVIRIPRDEEDTKK